MMSFEFILLLIAAFGAGFIDAIIGGGGLIQLPAVMFYMPAAEMPTIFGTNKFAGFAGTAIAAVKYTLKTKINYWAVIPALVTALPFAWLGARAVSLVDKDSLKPFIIVMFSLVAIYTFIKKDFGKAQAKNLSNKQSLAIALLTGVIIGFYDGFFGPGTGSFLVFIYVFLFGFDFLQASASAKLVNATTNIAALYFFILNGNIVYEVALPVAACNIGGSVLGTNMAIRKGTGFIRAAFLLVISMFIAKMAWDLYRS
jgi:uncharacterized protein